MTATYIALSTITLTGAQATVTFSSIPATYRDLILVFSGTTSAGTTLFGRFNSDGGANYTFNGMFGNGSSPGVVNGGSESFLYLGYPTTSRNTITVQVMDYSQTNKQKFALSRSSDASGFVTASVNRWSNTNAINTIQLSLASGTIAIGTTISLYGIN